MGCSLKTLLLELSIKRPPGQPDLSAGHLLAGGARRWRFIKRALLRSVEVGRPLGRPVLK